MLLRPGAVERDPSRPEAVAVECKEIQTEQSLFLRQELERTQLPRGVTIGPYIVGTGYSYGYFEMWPKPVVPIANPPYGGDYGDLNNDSCISGQGVTTPTEKIFFDHAILGVKFPYENVTYYDPSYATTYDDADDMQAQSVCALGTVLFSASIVQWWNLNNFVSLVRSPSGGGDLRFSPYNIIYWP
jgi:hypothetical protein